jgi:hypothetical protein
MLGYLRAIFAALVAVLDNQRAATEQAAADKADLDAQIAAVGKQLVALSAAVEHIRSLVEDSDEIPAAVGAPTFIATGGHQ